MATYTSHYQLHQWEASDSFLRTDFNTDFQKIDAAIKGVETAANTALAGKASTASLEAVQTLAEGKCGVVSGRYTGNGIGLWSISLGVYPQAVFISTYFATRTTPEDHVIVLQADGFQVRHNNNGISLNQSGITYHYLALV